MLAYQPNLHLYQVNYVELNTVSWKLYVTDVCVPHMCKNNGTCDGSTYGECQCQENYFGFYCEYHGWYHD